MKPIAINMTRWNNAKRSIQEKAMKLGGQRNQCPTCGELFNSNAAFDKHRTGDYGKALPGGVYSQNSRRCMSVEGMIAIGMAKASSGFWVTELMSAEVAAARGEE